MHNPLTCMKRSERNVLRGHQGARLLVSRCRILYFLVIKSYILLISQKLIYLFWRGWKTCKSRREKWEEFLEMSLRTGVWHRLYASCLACFCSTQVRHPRFIQKSFQCLPGGPKDFKDDYDPGRACQKHTLQGRMKTWKQTAMAWLLFLHRFAEST